MKKVYSQEELAALRHYANELAPGSYEQGHVKLTIALRECVNACSPLFRLAFAFLDFVLFVKRRGGCSQSEGGIMRENGRPGTYKVQQPWTSGYVRKGYPLCFALLPLALLLLPFAVVSEAWKRIKEAR